MNKLYLILVAILAFILGNISMYYGYSNRNEDLQSIAKQMQFNLAQYTFQEQKYKIEAEFYILESFKNYDNTVVDFEAVLPARVNNIKQSIQMLNELCNGFNCGEHTSKVHALSESTQHKIDELEFDYRLDGSK